MIEAPQIDDEKESPEWKRIKDYVGGANKASEHPISQELKRLQARQPEHFDDGGIAGDELPGLMGDLTPGSSSQQPGPVLPPVAPRGTLPPPAAPPVAGVPPVVPRNPAVPAAPAPTDATYDKKASDILGGITPEAIQRLMENLNQQGKKAQIGAGIAGIGDAIASVGGQTPGHMKNAEDIIQKEKELGMKLPGEMAAMGKERFGLSEQLQAKDPASPFSKVTQNANRQLLKSMGATDADINTMPATAINDVVGHQVTLQEALARIAQEGKYQQGMLENTKAQTQQGAAKALADRGIIKTAMDAIPGTAGNTAKKTLEKQAAGEPSAPAPTGAPVPAVANQADLDRLPAGAKYTFNGQPHTKRTK